VPEESVIREQQALREKTRFKLRLEEDIKKKIKPKIFCVFEKMCLLSDIDESRMNDNNDKMCLFHLEYLWVKTTFDISIK